MSNKAECLICGSYSSTIRHGLDSEGKCPICGTSETAILELEQLESKKKYYQSKKIESEIIQENKELKKELILKREKYKQMKDFVWNMYYEMDKITKELENNYMQKFKDWDLD